MNFGMLPDIKSCQMKAKRAHLSQQRIKKKAGQSLAVVFAQASVHNFQVFFKFSGRSVAILSAFASVPQPHDHERKKTPVKFSGRDSSEACRLFSHAFCILVEFS